MQYIIMSDGKGTRWNNHNKNTKQSIKIIDESLLERTVRLLKENNCNEILISSHDSRHEVLGARRIFSDYENNKKNQYAFDYLDCETTFLYGDTFYSEDCIQTIVNSKIDDLMFYGTEKAIVAVKVLDYNLFKEKIIDFDDYRKTIFHAFDNILFKNKKIERFYYLTDMFFNINKPEDYYELIRTIQESKGNIKKLGRSLNKK